MDIRLTSTVFQVFASNLTGSLNFYRLLGLPLPDSDGPHVAVELPGGNTLSFDSEETIARLTLAFGVGTPGEVDALYEKVTAAGYSGLLQPYDAPWGQRYATVADPDGNWVDLFAPLPS